MTAARALPYGGKDPRPTAAMKKFLVYMQECNGGWLSTDPIRIARSTVIAAGRLGWAVLERDATGWVSAASITAKGVAAYRWGSCDVHG